MVEPAETLGGHSPVPVNRHLQVTGVKKKVKYISMYSAIMTNNFGHVIYSVYIIEGKEAIFQSYKINNRNSSTISKHRILQYIPYLYLFSQNDIKVKGQGHLRICNHEFSISFVYGVIENVYQRCRLTFKSISNVALQPPPTPP